MKGREGKGERRKEGKRREGGGGGRESDGL